PSAEASFRNLVLNQRISVSNMFISPSIWEANGSAVDAEALAANKVEIYAGLDLSSVSDLTALVLIGNVAGKWHLLPTFWLPAKGMVEKAGSDHVPYDKWARDGLLQTSPGRTVSYEYVADYLHSAFARYNIRKLAFDAWNFAHLKPWLLKAGFTEEFITERFVEMRQG